MKHFMTAFACLFIMNVSAQTGFVEFPYNPDSDNDDMIGTEDLLGLLSLYGSEFSEEGLYLSEDSLSAVIFVGNFIYPLCLKSCSDLPGNWSLIKTKDVGLVWEDVTADVNQMTWINQPIQNSYPFSRLMVNGGDGWIASATNKFEEQNRCYCAAHERPNVEYSYCHFLNSPEEFGPCCDEKASNGWYPLASNPVADGSGAQSFSQAFWRWAE